MRAVAAVRLRLVVDRLDVGAELARARNGRVHVSDEDVAVSVRPDLEVGRRVRSAHVERGDGRVRGIFDRDGPVRVDRMVAGRIDGGREVDCVRTRGPADRPEAADGVGEVGAGSGVFDFAAGRGKGDSAAPGGAGVVELEHAARDRCPAGIGVDGGQVDRARAAYGQAPGAARTVLVGDDAADRSRLSDRLARAESDAFVALQKDSGTIGGAHAGACSAPSAACDRSIVERAALDGERGAGHHENIAACPEATASAAARTPVSGAEASPSASVGSDVAAAAATEAAGAGGAAATAASTASETAGATVEPPGADGAAATAETARAAPVITESNASRAAIDAAATPDGAPGAASAVGAAKPARPV